MRRFLLFLPLLVAVGCSQQAASPAASTGVQNDLTKKLAAMPVDQRAAYVKAHMGEVTSAAMPKAGPSK